MMSQQTIVLIRHTACAVEPGICYGHLDVPLAASATRDIADTLARIPSLDRIVLSPAQRCRLLAQAVATRDRCPMEVLEDLRELDFGDWEGRAWSAIEPTESTFWAEDPWTRAPPHGETEAQLWTRVQRAAARLQTRSGDYVGVVSHGGPLRLLRCLLNGLPLSQRWSMSPVLGSVECISCYFPLSPMDSPSAS